MHWTLERLVHVVIICSNERIIVQVKPQAHGIIAFTKSCAFDYQNRPKCYKLGSIKDDKMSN